MSLFATFPLALSVAMCDIASITTEADMTAQDLEEYAKRFDQQADRLERVYWGVRPGWVSTDIAIARNSAAEARRQADKLRGGSMMAAPSITLGQVKRLRPCLGAYKRLAETLPKRKRLTAADARKAGASFEDIIWVASAVARKDADVARRLRMWIADCAARVLHIFEQDYPIDHRPRNAIIAARQFANGEIDAAAWDAARYAAWDAAMAAAWDAAGDAARDAAGDAARDAARAAAWDAARYAAWDAARYAARCAARDAAWAAERKWQFDRLIMWLSENEPQPLALPGTKEASA